MSNNFDQLLKQFQGQRGPSPAGARGLKIALGLAVLGYGVSQSFFAVEGGFQAIKFNRLWGVGDKTFREGWHLRVPWLERPIIYDVRTRPMNITSLTGSKDLQMVNITLRVLHKPDDSKLAQIYRNLGMDYDQRVLPSIGNEVLKAVVAQFNAGDLVTKRELVSRQIKNVLMRRAADFNIILEDVSLVHIGFGSEYSAAIEAKQVAQQEAERAKFIVERAIQEKKSIIIRSEGEAKAAQLIGEAIQNNPGFIELRRIEASRKIAELMKRAGNKIYLDSDALLLNVAGVQSKELPKLGTFDTKALEEAFKRAELVKNANYSVSTENPEEEVIDVPVVAQTPVNKRR